jgi:hypothetical protein
MVLEDRRIRAERRAGIGLVDQVGLEDAFGARGLVQHRPRIGADPGGGGRVEIQAMTGGWAMCTTVRSPPPPAAFGAM